MRLQLSERGIHTSDALFLGTACAAAAIHFDSIHRATITRTNNLTVKRNFEPQRAPVSKGR